MTEARLVRRISGSVNSGRASKSSSLYSRMQMPSATRPQRPLRWLADACETGSIGSRCTFVRLAVPGDPRGAGVDHVPDARHGQRGLGDVGGQHDPAAAGAAAKTRCCSAADSRAYSGSTSSVARSAARPARRRCRGSPARRTGTPGCRRALRRELVDRVDDAADLVARLAVAVAVRRRPAAGSAPRPGRCARTPR